MGGVSSVTCCIGCTGDHVTSLRSAHVQVSDFLPGNGCAVPEMESVKPGQYNLLIHLVIELGALIK